MNELFIEIEQEDFKIYERGIKEKLGRYFVTPVLFTRVDLS